MSEIRPAEVSEILKKELAGLENVSQFEEVGVVLEVGDGIARIYGLSDVQSGELIEFKNGSQGIVLNPIMLGPFLWIHLILLNRVML